MPKFGVAKFVMTSFGLHDFPALAFQARQKLLAVPLQYRSRFRGHTYTHMRSQIKILVCIMIHTKLAVPMTEPETNYRLWACCQSPRRAGEQDAGGIGRGALGLVYSVPDHRQRAAA